MYIYIYIYTHIYIYHHLIKEMNFGLRPSAAAGRVRAHPRVNPAAASVRIEDGRRRTRGIKARLLLWVCKALPYGPLRKKVQSIRYTYVYIHIHIHKYMDCCFGFARHCRTGCYERKYGGGGGSRRVNPI